MVMIMVIDYPGSTTMQTIQASEFKARCLAELRTYLSV